MLCLRFAPVFNLGIICNLKKGTISGFGPEKDIYFSPVIPGMQSTGSPVLDRLLGGTYPPEILTVVYGPAASGKTTCCLLAALQTVAAGKKVFFVDTEGGFSPERLTQLADDMSEFRDTPIKDVLANILLFSPKDFKEQAASIKLIDELMGKSPIGLVVVDTIGKHYRLVLRRNPKGVNNMMGKQLDVLRKIARETSATVLLTNQVYQKMDGGVKNVGGNMVVRRSKCLIELAKNEHLRRAILRKHPEIHGNAIGNSFEITAEGLMPRNSFTIG